MSHHHTYYVTSSYILCHIIIHTIEIHSRARTYAHTHTLACVCGYTQTQGKSERTHCGMYISVYIRVSIHWRIIYTYNVCLYRPGGRARERTLACREREYAVAYILCHIIIHTMSHHHTYYVTSSYILSRIRSGIHMSVYIRVSIHSRITSVCLYRPGERARERAAAGIHSHKSSLQWLYIVNVLGHWLFRMWPAAAESQRTHTTNGYPTCRGVLYRMCSL